MPDELPVIMGLLDSITRVAEGGGVFLTYLATERHVFSSTQNQALSVILFLYCDALVVKYPNAAKEWGLAVCVCSEKLLCGLAQ
jgi:hypothetical protein